MTKIVKLSLSALLLAGTALSAQTASARPMTAEDLATLKRVGEPAVSPDQRWTAFSVTETEPENYARSSALYLLDMSAKNSSPVRIADQKGHSEHGPSFSADSKSLYYLSDASGSDQLWRVTISDKGASGKPEQASDLKTDIAGYRLSPTGDKVAVWGDIAKNCPTFGCEDDGDISKPGPGTGREYEQMFVRHWDKWETPGNYSRIFAFDIAAGKLTGNGMALDGDLIGDSPSKPFGGAEEVAWTPDGEAVAFVLRKADRNEPLSTDLDIYATKVSAGGKPEAMPSNGPATDNLPVFSPNNELIAWAAMERPGYEADRMVLKVMGKDDGTRVITGDWDRSVSSIAWSHDSKKIIVTADEILDHPAFEVDVASGKVKRLTGEGSVGNVIPMKDGSILYTLASLQSPPEIFRKAPASAAVQLTNMNGKAMADIDKVTVQRFDFKGAGGDQVWGMIIKPVDTKAPLPMAFVVHGGPQGSFGDSWSTRWNPKVMAAQGYAVVTIDFHGSTGYGQAFTDSINKDWGGKPLTDLKLGYDAALKIDSQIEKDNACALGASYGGYMMNWIAGQWPDRFKCLIQHDGVFDSRAMAYETEELWFDEWEHGGPYFKVPEEYEKWNPVHHVDKWKTPMLVITGEKDFRIPYTQGLAAFTALQRRNIPSKLLVFPDENHWVLKGKNSVQWHKNVFDWMKKWTR